MRISDSMLSNNFIFNLNKTRESEENLRLQISTGSKINKPSDSPSGTATLLRLNNQIGQSDAYTKNVQDSLSYVQDSTSNMENIQNEMVKVMSNLTSVQNSAVDSTLGSFADQIDSSLNNILDAANAQSDGKYLFGGTDFSAGPYALSSDKESVLTQVNTSGSQSVKISPNSTQKINITGTELFGTIVKQNGTFDAASTVGTITNSTTKVYDNAGKSYDLNLTYTKTGTDTYSMNYDILDNSGTSVYSSPPAANTLNFDSKTQQLISVNNSQNTNLNIKSTSNNINFNLDLSPLNEGVAAQPLSLNANQKTDIFNTLIAIRDGLRNGIRPTDAQVQTVSDFNSHILDKLIVAGNITNQLQNTGDLLTNHKSVLTDMVSTTQSVDVAQAITDLQNQDYILQLSLKVSATILPKSLLDYL
jgi:flagellar hook-associated protein 3 FlgL